VKRRDLLRSAMAGIPAALVQGQRQASPDESWRFGVGDDGRWSLARGREVALSDVAIRVELAGQPPFTLRELEGVRRMRSGPRRGPQTLMRVGRMGAI